MLGSRAEDPDQRRWVEERMRCSMTADMAQEHLHLNYSMDVKAECALLQCRTLVMHAEGDQMVGFDQGRKLAAWIPGARFVPLTCDSHMPPPTHEAARTFVQETHAFLGSAFKPDKPRLSRRQTEILTLVAQGMTDKQVAREIGLSPRTVEMHVALALRALASANRMEAVHRARQEGLLEP
jgi:DNA-binding CsgD family transcriptional regulator